MKVLVFGRGVIGTMYGWALERAGHEVEFLVRPGRAKIYGPDIHLNIYDARTKMGGVAVKMTWPVAMVENLPEDHDYDLILVSVQHYRFEEASAYLANRTGRASILIFNNFWVDPQAASTALPADQLVWGFPMAGGGFDQNGTLKGAFFRRVHFGTFHTDPTKRELAIRALFKGIGFKIKEHRDFRGWLWTHFAINAGLLGQALQTGSMLRVMQTTSEGKRAVLNVRELLPLLRARDVDLKAQASDIGLFKLPAWIGALALKIATMNKPMRAIVDGNANPEEMRRFCRDALAEARNLRIPVPRLAKAQYLFLPEGGLDERPS